MALEKVLVSSWDGDGGIPVALSSSGRGPCWSSCCQIERTSECRSRKEAVEARWSSLDRLAAITVSEAIMEPDKFVTSQAFAITS